MVLPWNHTSGTTFSLLKLSNSSLEIQLPKCILTETEDEHIQAQIKASQSHLRRPE